MINSSEEESIGSLTARYIYNPSEEVEATRKGGVALNLRINKKDLEAVDFIAEHFGFSRNRILSMLLEKNVMSMFDLFTRGAQYELSKIADGYISQQEGVKHIYDNKTWCMQFMEIRAELECPGNFFKSIFD